MKCDASASIHIPSSLEYAAYSQEGAQRRRGALSGASRNSRHRFSNAGMADYRDRWPLRLSKRKRR